MINDSFVISQKIKKSESPIPYSLRRRPCHSRFHKKLSKNSADNPKFDGSTPRDGADYLQKVWTQIRANLGRAGIRIYGFRVAEPHHDATPHWHLRNTGAALSPHSAFLLLQGLETLALRMERHCENALKVAKFLNKHPQVEWVNYPALPDSPYKALIDRDYGGKASGLLSFGIKGGREAGAKFIDALQLFLRLVNIGDTKSLATHPATTTHRQLDDTELAAAGVSPDMVRLSVGIEHIDDLLADLAQALEAAQA